ncbi:glycerol-3-phosphate acyltransferase PlsY [Planomicrobium stackebrandtii]|uniref:Glycerol-3-phosphate acyltransferase n=1 Tax=Planomicrobium stackebrandtii TaxID=253160 RepID=A0ABU0GT99_9BACL|nr:glycerol-3-phosphate acyltransferase [Planomicrobium stackebrandtii]MDQ0428184.1 glycerol-3-phosphate acyltransferase PlsY [Planomicrobium stackebrandtii]
MLMWVLVLFIAGYIIGCFHGSLAAQALSGINVKKEGVKNSGASNAAIVLGWKYGLLVAFIDIFKGFAAVAGLRLLLETGSFSSEMTWALLFVAGAGVVFGHNFPFYMNFNGGKGTASVIGVMLALDWKLGLLGLLLLIGVSLATDYLVIGVLVLYAIYFVIAVGPASGAWPLLTASALFAMAVWKHSENIIRIKDGTENKVSSVLGKKSTTSN